MNIKKQPAAASLFVVIFTTILVTVVTVSFIQIMIRGHEQSQAADLAQSAYDGALAGVEDSKRLLVGSLKCNKTPTEAGCSSIQTALGAASTKCETIIDAGIATKKNKTQSEVAIGSADMNESYTCVKIDPNATYFPVVLSAAKPVAIIPIRTADRAAAEKIRMNWLTKEDIADVASPALSFPADAVGKKLTPYSQWVTGPTAAAVQPPMLRYMYIPAGATNDPDDKAARTVFSYPMSGSSFSANEDDRNNRFAISDSGCVNNLTSQPLGACKSEYKPSTPIISTGGNGYVVVSAIYPNRKSGASKTTVNLQLLNASGDPMKLDGIASVDATGKTANRVRRVIAMVNYGESANPGRPLPNATLELAGNLCKTFFITDNSAEYKPGNCQP